MCPCRSITVGLSARVCILVRNSSVRGVECVCLDRIHHNPNVTGSNSFQTRPSEQAAACRACASALSVLSVALLSP